MKVLTLSRERHDRDPGAGPTREPGAKDEPLRFGDLNFIAGGWRFPAQFQEMVFRRGALQCLEVCDHVVLVFLGQHVRIRRHSIPAVVDKLTNVLFCNRLSVHELFLFEQSLE